MKAARFHGARDRRVEAVPAPGDPGPGDVVVAPRLCGICGTDLHEYLDGPISTTTEPHPLTGSTLPQILGHELSAELVAIGAGVRSVGPGDRVTAMPNLFCGECFFCRSDEPRLCPRMGTIGLNWDWGGMAELAVIDEVNAVPLPAEMSDRQGALVEPTAVAVYAVDRSGLRPGESVLVSGGGPIGALACLAAAAAGAGAVYVSEPNRRRTARLETLGVTRIFDPTVESVADELRDGVGVDVAIECSGVAAALAVAVDAVRPGVRVMQTGLFGAPATVEPRAWTTKDLTIEGTWCSPPSSFARVAGLIASGRLPAERVITSTIGLEDTRARVFEALADPQATR